MKTTIGGIEMRVEWIYPDPTKTWTICNIYRGDERVPTLSGYALRNGSDRFVKEVGRKVSLTRALTNVPREERRRVWEDYFGRSV